jgi:hypothetical protein
VEPLHPYVPGTAYVPDLECNLVSGTQLIKQGKKIVMELDKIDHNDLKIYEDGKIVATGGVKDGLILMNNDNKINRESEQKHTVLITLAEHSRYGHYGTPNEPCNTCSEYKQRRRNIPKISKNPSSHVLEKVSVDIQGPFPVKGIDGTKMNIKIVDNFSGYIKMETILNKEWLLKT